MMLKSMSNFALEEGEMMTGCVRAMQGVGVVIVSCNKAVLMMMLKSISNLAWVR